MRVCLHYVTSVKSIDDERRVLREAAANPDEQAALHSLLKETRSPLDPEDEEGLEDEEEKEIVYTLRGMVIELKSIRQ